jgi:nucleoside-diphosphate-sugar epimerase
MKIIVAGATGLVGSEIIRQCLDIRAVTEVIALARKPIQIDESTNFSKVKTVLIEDYGYYPDHVKAAFAGADACIWCVEKSISSDPLTTD